LSPDQSSSGSAARPQAVTANDFIEQELDARIREIEGSFGADAIAFSGPIIIGVDDVLRRAIEGKHAMKSGRQKLAFLVTTTGGYIEVVQRIVYNPQKTLRAG
jgi:hypothetical protein